jgi:hypothetical protein
MAISMLATQKKQPFVWYAQYTVRAVKNGGGAECAGYFGCRRYDQCQNYDAFQNLGRCFHWIEWIFFLIFYWQSFTEGLFLFESYSESFLIHLFL